MYQIGATVPHWRTRDRSQVLEEAALMASPDTSTDQDHATGAESRTATRYRIKPTTTELIDRALAGEQRAWTDLVARYEKLVWKAVIMVTSDRHDQEDAFSRTWLRASESLATVRNPERLAGWLSVIATREAIAVARARSDLLSADPGTVERFPGRSPNGHSGQRLPEDFVIDSESAAILRRGFQQLDEGCRQLLALLILSDPPLSYEEVQHTMQRPHGWIGPTRRRCIDKLRQTPAIEGLLNDHPMEAGR